MNGSYGTRKPAYINTEDCDIYYCYRPTRSSDSPEFSTFKELSTDNLTISRVTNTDSNEASVELPGMYDLRLPINQFSKAGFYTIYIKPKEYYTTIVDVSTLAAYPNIRGIVLSKTDLPGGSEDNGLTGYRVEYFKNGTRDYTTYRIITSSNACEPIAQNMSDSSQKGIRYRFNDTGNLLFCTVTPSTALSFKSSTQPYIGSVGEQIALVSTAFNPVAIEIEMTKNDIDGITTMLEGSQIRNLDEGIITTFDNDGNIYNQSLYGNITNPAQGINHDVKIKNDEVINFTEQENFEKIRSQF
jgi:hypothetical protein